MDRSPTRGKAKHRLALNDTNLPLGFGDVWGVLACCPGIGLGIGLGNGLGCHFTVEEWNGA